MKNSTQSSWLLPAVLLITGLCSISPVQASICPLAERIDPCFCFVQDNRPGEATIMCIGSEVTDTTMAKVMKEMRQVNGVSGPADWLEVFQIIMRETSITTFDLTPFIRTRIYQLESWHNTQITSIVGPPLPKYEGLIDVAAVWFSTSYLVDEDFKDFFKYFSSRMTYLDLTGTNVNGSYTNLIGDGSGDIEFLPGMSRLSNLQTLYLTRNDITSVANGQFKRNNRLIDMDLGDNVEEIGENAFLFDDPSSDMVDEWLDIFITGTKISQDDIHVNCGIDRIKRPVFWRLYSNQLTSMPVQKFQPFLDANPKNKITVYDNPIVCDGRVKWIKDRRDEYEGRVLAAACVNDPGQTVFTSSLVDQ